MLKFLKEVEIAQFVRLTCNPDLNPIEHVWDRLGRCIQKFFSEVILENIVFYVFLNCYMKNIQKLISYKKVNIDFCLQTSKWPCPTTNGLSQFFQHKLKNIRKVFLLESLLIRKKILWRINFVLIKFSPNALLFQKLQDECKKTSFLHKVICIRLDHAGAVAKFHIHGFIL